MGRPLSFIRSLLARSSASACELPHLRTHCPRCGMRVVEARYVSMNLASSFGPSPSWTFSDDELTDLCPLHQMLSQALVAGADDPL